MASLLGGCVIALAAFLAGTTGFGFALLSAPLLLLIGYPLEFVVTANLTLALVTRVSVSYRFRTHVVPRRVAQLVGGSIPGFYLGAKILTSVDESVIKLAAGTTIVVIALLLGRAVNAPPPPQIPGASSIAGFAGGLLGSTTSLSGIPPALLLAREKARPLSFIADLALYFVVSNSIALILLATQGAISTEALFPTSLLWLPGAMLGNLIGVALAPQLPEKIFRCLTLAIACVAGGVTVITSDVF